MGNIERAMCRHVHQGLIIPPVVKEAKPTKARAEHTISTTSTSTLAPILSLTDKGAFLKEDGQLARFTRPPKSTRLEAGSFLHHSLFVALDYASSRVDWIGLRWAFAS